MVSNIEITEFLLKQVANSVRIAEYCDQNFKRSLVQMVGVDINNAPIDEDAPFLIYEPIIKNIGGSESYFEYEFYLKLGVKGGDKAKKDGDIIRYEGIYQIEELGNLIAYALKEAIGCKSNLDAYEVNFYHDELNAFPLYSGTIIFRFSVPQVIGEEQIKFKEI